MVPQCLRLGRFQVSLGRRQSRSSTNCRGSKKRCKEFRVKQDSCLPRGVSLGRKAPNLAYGGVPKVPISVGTGAGKRWIGLETTGTAHKSKRLTCLRLGRICSVFGDFRGQEQCYWRRGGDSNPRYSF